MNEIEITNVYLYNFSDPGVFTEIIDVEMPLARRISKTWRAEDPDNDCFLSTNLDWIEHEKEPVKITTVTVEDWFKRKDE